MNGSRWARIAAACGLGFAVSYILILLVSGNNPQDGDSDQKIASWYASHSHQVREFIIFFIGAVGALLFIWFLSHLLSLVRRASGEGSIASTVVLISGTAFVTLFAVMGALFAGPAFVLIDAGHKFTLDPNTFRVINGLGAMAYMGAFILLAPVAFTVGAVAWRTGVLPRWLAVLSFVGGVGALASPIWFPSFLAVAWILVLSVYLVIRRPAPARVATPATAAA